MHAIMILFKQNLEQEVLNKHKRHKRCQHVNYSRVNDAGGGFEKLQFGKAPSICLTVPMEAVVFKAEQPVVHPKGLRDSFSPQCNPGYQHAV